MRFIWLREFKIVLSNALHSYILTKEKQLQIREKISIVGFVLFTMQCFRFLYILKFKIFQQKYNVQHNIIK